MYKPFTIILALILSGTALYAQTSSGNMMAGGSLEIASNSRESGSTDASFTFGPNFGYFISDNLAIGAGLTIESSRSGTGASKSTSSAFAFGPFARYYMFTSNDNLAFFGQATLSFGTGKNDPAVGNVTHSHSIGFSVSPGAAYFFNEHWAAEVSVTGFAISSSDPNTDADNDKVTNVRFILRSFSPTLGFRYHF